MHAHTRRVSRFLDFDVPFTVQDDTQDKDDKRTTVKGRVDDMNTRMEKAAKVERASMIRGWRTDKQCDIKWMEVCEVLASDHCRC